MSDIQQPESQEEQPSVEQSATTEEEEQQQEPEPDTPEVKEDTPEDSNQHPAAEESPQEESQPEEQQFGEVQAQDTTQSEEKKPKEESSTVQDEAPPVQPPSKDAQPEGAETKPGEDVTEQKEEAVSTTTTEQEAPKDDAAEIQSATAPEPAATTKGGDDQAKKVSTEVKEIPTAEPEETVKEKPKRLKVRTTIPMEGVDLAIGEGPLEGAEPITFGQQFKDTLKKYADVPALKWKVKEGEGEESVIYWKSATYVEYYKSCVDAAKSLIKLRLEDNHGVGIIGCNSPEWVISNNAAIFAGGLPTGIHATNGPGTCHYVLEDSKSNVVLVENQKQLDKILQVRDRLPHLKAIVQYKGKLSQAYDNVYDWEQFMELGKDMEDSVIEEKIKAQKPEQCALVNYTSGTTGTVNLRGVMLSHDNLTWTAKILHGMTGDQYGLEIGCERVVSYLPLSHIAAQIEDIYLCVYGAATLHFAQPDALKGSLLQTLVEVRPTLFFGTKRAWEKLHECARVQEVIYEETGDQWVRNLTLQGNPNLQNRCGLPWTFKIADNFILKKVYERIGLDCVKIVLTNAVPKTIEEFFMSINIPQLGIFGMGEADPLEIVGHDTNRVKEVHNRQVRRPIQQNHGDSAASEAFRKCRMALSTGITSTEAEVLANSLYSKKIISIETLECVLLDTCPIKKKLILLNAVEARLRIHPSDFDQLYSILACDGHLCVFADILQSCYYQYQAVGL